MLCRQHKRIWASCPSPVYLLPQDTEAYQAGLAVPPQHSTYLTDTLHSSFAANQNPSS